jgi:hypothetical protein
MTRVFRKLALSGLVAGLCLGACLTPAEALWVVQQQQTPKKTVTKKGKTAKKATSAPDMPAEGEKPALAVAGAEGGMKFSRDIAPILVANCGGCHNPQAPQFKRSQFSLATFEGLMKGGKAGQPVTPGNPDESLLVGRIKGEPGPKMPPGNNRLSENAIAKIERWVKDGAKLDAGIDATAPMAKYAPSAEDLRKSELARLRPEDRDKKTEATARDRLKKADPKSNPEMTASAHFLLFAEMPKDRATAMLKTMEAQHTKLSRLLSGNRESGLNGPEKIGLYVFKDRKGFSEFVRTIENQDVDANDAARSKLNVESPYVLAIDPLAGAPEPAATKKPARTKKGADEPTGGPDRLLAALLTEQLTAGTLAQAGKPPRWLTSGVGAWMSSAIEPKSPYYRKIRAEAYAQCKQGNWQTKAPEALGDQTKPETVRAVGFAVVEWLYGTDPEAFANFVQGMLQGGDKLDETIAACLNGNREQFLVYTGAFVEQRYAGGR